MKTTNSTTVIAPQRDAERLERRGARRLERPGRGGPPRAPEPRGEEDAALRVVAGHGRVALALHEAAEQVHRRVPAALERRERASRLGVRPPLLGVQFAAARRAAHGRDPPAQRLAHGHVAVALGGDEAPQLGDCLLYTSPSPRD